jgi:hypothetical protein
VTNKLCEEETKKKLSSDRGGMRICVSFVEKRDYDAMLIGRVSVMMMEEGTEVCALVCEVLPED